MQEDLELSVGIGGEKAFIASLKAMEDAVEKLGDELRELGKKSAPVKDPFKELPEKAKPAAGSIAAVNQKLSELNSKFISTGNALERSQLKVQMDALNKELKEMSGTGGGGGGIPKATSSVSMFSSALSTLGITLGAAAVVGGIKSLGQAAIGAAMDYESLGIQLEVLLGDAKQVPKVLADWKRFSDVTPFEPEQVNKAGRQLLGFGIEVDKIIPKMTMLGDISAGTGKDFNELVGIYGKALAKGKVQGEVLDMLADATINIIPYLAEAMGVAKEEVAKLGSEGKISIEAFDKALALMTSSGSRYGGMMDKLSQSTEGILSTLKGEFDGLLREVGTAFLPIIKELAMAAIPAIQNALVSLKPYLAELPNMFARAKETAMGIIQPLISIYDSLKRIAAPILEAIGGMDGLGSTLTIVSPKFGLLGDVLGIVADVLGAVADAVEWVNGKWDALVANYPKVAKAIEYILLPLKMMVSPLETIGGLWEDIFGTGEESVGGLADASKKKLGDFSKYLQSSFGATSQQVVGFAKSFDMARVAGMSEADAMYEVKKAFGIYIATCDEATTSTDALGGALTDASKKAVPAAGSIDALNERLKVLKDQYNATASASERLRLGGLIQDAEIQVELMNAQGDAMGNVAMKTKAVNDEFTKLQGTTSNMMRSTDGMGSMHEMLMQIPLDLETTTTAWERFQAKIGEGASGQLKQGIDSIKNAFRDFGAQAAESIGYAIGSAGSAAQAFKAAVSQMLVQIPKLAGMALLNAAAFPANAAISLPLAAAGLALLGLSGIIGGVQAKNAREQEALADSMSDLPTSATGAAGAASLGGLGGYTGASQQQAPVMVNVNAEMDGVQLGGLIKRVTTNYNKTTIKQR